MINLLLRNILLHRIFSCILLSSLTITIALSTTAHQAASIQKVQKKRHWSRAKKIAALLAAAAIVSGAGYYALRSPSSGAVSSGTPSLNKKGVMTILPEPSTTPTKKIVENDDYFAAKGDTCLFPTHLYIMPKDESITSIENLDTTNADHQAAFCNMISLARELAQKHGNKGDHGFNLVLQNGASAGQKSPQLCWHFLGGIRRYFAYNQALASANTRKAAKQPLTISGQHATNSSCTFCKILSGADTKVTIVAQNEHAVAIQERYPRSKYHYLVIPRKHIKNINATSQDDDQALVGMLALIQELAKTYGNAPDQGFTMVANNESSAEQTVFHMHWHFIAGSKIVFTPTIAFAPSSEIAKYESNA